MELKRLCIENLNIAIELTNEIKCLIHKNKFTEAINVVADVLYVLGQTLLCINRAEFNRMFNTHESDTYKGKTKPAEMTMSSPENMCLQLVDAAINNLQQAKQYIKQNRWEDAENIIATTISGRILRCLNSLQQKDQHSYPPVCTYPSKKYKNS